MTLSDKRHRGGCGPIFDLLYGDGKVIVHPAYQLGEHTLPFNIGTVYAPSRQSLAQQMPHEPEVIVGEV